MITRRHVIRLLPLALATPAFASEHLALAFMNEVASQLLKAHRLGTVPAFMRVIQRYADIPAIAEYSLGEYKIDPGQTALYQRGVAQFISRYFVDQSRSYPIAKYEIGAATVAPNKDVTISSRVYLMAGQIYTVTWLLTWSNGSYKVADAKFLGFSMTAQERSLFTSFIAKHNGDVGQLVIALNR